MSVLIHDTHKNMFELFVWAAAMSGTVVALA